ncbi:MAG: hypothetical protein KC425_22350 [Anaerolineales bacterium]|nr:hypothetical protein [Anaerolineales bacterium]
MSQPEKEFQDVYDKLAQLAPGPSDAPQPASRALAQVRRRAEAPRPFPARSGFGRWFANPNRRLATALAALILVFGVAFSFPTVRAAASDFLGLFRVQKFAAISIDPQQLAMLQQLEAEGLSPGEIIIDRAPGASRPVDSLAAASLQTGLARIGTPALRGAPAAIQVADGGDGRLRIDLAGARAIFAAVGMDPALLPATADGKTIRIIVFPSVDQTWADGTWLLQTESPIVEYPAELNATALGSATLQLLGVSPAEADRLARTIDWTSTLLLPIPRDFATFSEVTVNGSSGLALYGSDGVHGAVIWQQGGVLFALGGPFDTAELVRLANSVR